MDIGIRVKIIITTNTKNYELQKKRKLRSINAWNRSEFSNRRSVNISIWNH